VRLLDLFCGTGGAALGYHRAGFTVVGVDDKPQPRYPFAFHLADAFEYLREHGEEFDVIHASPPCQKFSAFQFSQPQRLTAHRDLITPIRELLCEIGRPYVIENVEGAPLRDPVRCCGTAFGLGVSRGQLLRHRLFESSVPIYGTRCRHEGPSVMVCGHGKDGYRGNGLSAAEARIAMQMPWATRDGIAQAIPPAYTEYIGHQLLTFLRKEDSDGRSLPWYLLDLRLRQAGESAEALHDALQPLGTSPPDGGV
jgi:DNA (cytosine-5)-methyltransferase 1